ncbi:MAG: hypothetical protein AMXMBFR82_50840 [Candidatus Hydrogenedentota bacterium]
MAGRRDIRPPTGIPALKAPRNPSQGQNEVAPLVRCRALLEPCKGERRRIGKDAVNPYLVSPLQGFVVGCARVPGALPLARVAARLQRAGAARGGVAWKSRQTGNAVAREQYGQDVPRRHEGHERNAGNARKAGAVRNRRERMERNCRMPVARMQRIGADGAFATGTSM